MTSTEGVVKYQLEFNWTAAVSFETVRKLSAWRKLLYRIRLIGQDPDRYHGFGYGNISQLTPPFDAPAYQRPFIISGTNTGKYEDLKAAHYAIVKSCHPEQNRVVAEGPIHPSSESLTHAAVYAENNAIHFVIHAHSPDIWRFALDLDIPVTHPEVAYGTPEMAAEVQRLFQETGVQKKGIFAMGGHKDGVVAFGNTLEEAGFALLEHLAKAFERSA